MDELKHDNAIYEQVDPPEPKCITVKKNESYELVKIQTKDRNNKSLEEKPSHKKVVVVINLTLAILVLFLAAVAVSAGYALFQVSKLNTEISSSSTNSQQVFQNVSAVISDLLQQQALIEEQYENLTQQLNDRIVQVQILSSQQYSTLDSRIVSTQNAISSLQKQSAQNDSALDARIENITYLLSENNFICGGTSGWRRVGYLDMTDPSQSCPSGLALKYYSPGLRSCGRATNGSRGCWSTFYNTGSSQYSRVCGRVRGYQFGSTDAFYHRLQDINSYYVEGVSLTYGQNSNRSHIWTFAASLTESNSGGYSRSKCPCTTSSDTQSPAFIGNDYFCESGFHGVWVVLSHRSLFFPNDPLWDGQNCIDNCCQFNNPPYFIKNLPAPTTDDIELRICNDGPAIYGDTPIDQLELYVAA